MEIGRKIRKIRKLQRRTQQDVADKAGITKSLLSKIETEKTIPPLATLNRIANALGVNMNVFLGAGDEKDTTVYTRAQDITSFVETEKGYRFFAFAAQRINKRMQIYLFEAQRGRVTPSPLSHSGEEFVYILEGSARYRVGSITYTLNPGDSLYFDAEDEHDLEPISEWVRYLAVFVER